MQYHSVISRILVATGLIGLMLVAGCGGGGKPASKSEKTGTAAKSKSQKAKPAESNEKGAEFDASAPNPFFAPASTETATASKPAEPAPSRTRPRESATPPAANPANPAKAVEVADLSKTPEHPIPGQPLIKIQGGVRDLVWTRDGRRVIGVNYDHLILINVAAGVAEKTPFIDAIQLALSPDEQTLAVATAKASIEFWSMADLRKGPNAKTAAGNRDNPILDLAYSSDGKSVYSVTYDAKSVTVWNPVDGSQVSEISTGELGIHQFAASPAGDLLALSGEVKTGEFQITKKLCLWDAKSGKLKYELDNQPQSIPSALKFSSDGKLLAVGGDLDPSLRIWDTQTGKMLKDLQGHGREVKSIAFFDQDRRLVSGGNDQVVRTFDTGTGESQSELIGSRDFIFSVAGAPRVPWVVSADTSEIRFWDLEVAAKDPQHYARTGDETRNIKAHSKGGLWHIDVSSNGKYVVSQASNEMKLWDAESGKMLKMIEGQAEGAAPVAISPDGKLMAHISGFREVELYSVPDGKLQHKFSHDNISWARQMMFTPDGSRLILAAGKHLFVWDVARKTLLKTWEGDEKEIESMTLTSDAGQLVTGSETGKIAFWDLKTFKLLKSFEAGTSKVLAMALNSDDSQLATTAFDQPLQVRDLKSDMVVTTRKVNNSRIDCVLFLPGTNLLALPAGASHEQFSDRSFQWAIWIVDAATGKNVKSFKGHTDSPMSLRYSAARKQLISGGQDGSIKFWDLDPAQLKSP